MTAEHERFNEDRLHPGIWKRWGPYLSERQWGTVREDYSSDGNSWDYFSHDQARSRTYRWGEDGLAGISDDKQQLCFALVLWNGRDPIIKERLFGLTNREGNHGEDVKEYYYYLDNTPTHSYMKYLYKYPQQAFPYEDLVVKNRQRSQAEPEYELLDTGVFNEDRYFDVFVEYAKAGPEDILVQIKVHNRGPESAEIHLLPTLWFRNDWALRLAKKHTRKPLLRQMSAPQGMNLIEASHSELGRWLLYCQGQPTLLFTENSTNMERIFGKHNKSPYVKDGINNYIVHHRSEAVNPENKGTKAAAHYRLNIGAGQSSEIRLRLIGQHTAGKSKKTAGKVEPFGSGFDEMLSSRLQEADAFYQSVIPQSVSPDAANVMRQALAGMLWSKQFYYYNVSRWLKEHKAHPLDAGSRPCRNRDWYHMINADIISMPDKWEYPWYAAWDLAFHTLPLSIVDSDFAKQQMELLLHGFYLHPNGQLPAYEWNFSDVNPPVHAWATLFLYRLEQALHGTTDLDFLKSAFNKLVVNFTWWVNRKDRFGKNVFEGGFLGLDNIGVFDRSSSLPTGGYLEQADGTAWMALFAQNMVEMSVELAGSDPCYDDMAFKFLEHFYFIAHAINHPGHDSMWDEQDGFYYDVLVCPDGSATRLKVRSMVGLLPLCATTVVEKWQRERIPKTLAAAEIRMRQSPGLFESIHPTGPQHLGVADRGIFALLTPDRLRRILSTMLDENEFLSPYGIRSLSKFHEKNPYLFHVGKQEYRVSYLPAESDTGMFGGNSNWRGPVWMPVNILLIRGLIQFYLYYGDNFKVECPTGSGRMMNLFEVAKEIGERLTRIFLRNAKGRRPVYGSAEKFQNDPYWRDYLLFYEYFHGDNGTGIGASHQTGWTGLIAKIIQIVSAVDPKKVLEAGKKGSIHGQ
ncbi:MAG TPA: hypothetical protein PKB02_09810 [Anaerohalosphaeraceae bacterium]|nr:hypothetical protein [Anaerohalosphaeraceae bacterium]